MNYMVWIKSISYGIVQKLHDRRRQKRLRQSIKRLAFPQKASNQGYLSMHLTQHFSPVYSNYGHLTNLSSNCTCMKMTPEQHEDQSVEPYRISFEQALAEENWQLAQDVIEDASDYLTSNQLKDWLKELHEAMKEE